MNVEQMLNLFPISDCAPGQDTDRSLGDILLQTEPNAFRVARNR